MSVKVVIPERDLLGVVTKEADRQGRVLVGREYAGLELRVYITVPESRTERLRKDKIQSDLETLFDALADGANIDSDSFKRGQAYIGKFKTKGVLE